ncbi:MAG: hypothetical protein M4D80_24260 [Myxococcota bacterium]|nr:hypothetical protein [Myxococcota bacterium]
MRSMLFLVLLAFACKDDNEQQATKPPPSPKLPEVVTEDVLPAEFPLPASSTKKLVRAQKKLTMLVWEYALPDVSAADATKSITDGMRSNGWSLASNETVAGTQKLTATHNGRMYAVAIAPAAKGSSVAIRSFPEAGPTTLNAPASYPTKFPFLAGGTASHAPDGARLTIAYQSDPRDIEHAMVVAAVAAGWTCTGTGNVTCTKEKSNVTFTTEEARGGSLLVVSAP